MSIFPGSRISSPSGDLYIEEIRAGCPVLTRSGLVPAGQPESRRADGCFTIITLASNRQLLATSDQPVMVVNRGWTRARDVFKGDRVFTIAGPQTVCRLNYWKTRETVWSLPAAECYVEGFLCGRE